MIGSFIALALVLLGVGLALCAATVYLLARALAMPPRMTDGKAAYVVKRLSPGDLGLKFSEIEFKVNDVRSGEPLRIAGWWIPHEQARGRTVILIHGYADAKVGAIAWAPTWHALGWNILAIDLRAHGESGGRFCTGGYFERDDVGQVINELRARLPEQTRRLALFGVSSGAAVAVATAAQRDDVDAVVLDSPVSDFADAAMLQMQRLGAPSRALQRLAVRVAERMTGAKLAHVRLLDLLPKLRCGVFVIAPEHDDLFEGGVREALRAATETRPTGRGPGVFWLVPDTRHLLAIARDPQEYCTRLADFLARTTAGGAGET